MSEKSNSMILIADDDEQFRISLSKIFAKNGYEVTCVPNGVEASQLVKKQSYDLVIADLRMPGKNGIELTREIKKENSAVQVIIITAFGEQTSQKEALEAAKLASENKWKIMVSHRSGETTDAFIADLAVGIGCGQIKSGAPCRGERLAKYNQLLRIEEELGTRSKYGR